MNQKTLKVEIDADGAVSFEVAGVQGPKCLDVTRRFREALGIADSKIQRKPEFSQSGPGSSVHLQTT